MGLDAQCMPSATLRVYFIFIFILLLLWFSFVILVLFAVDSSLKVRDQIKLYLSRILPNRTHTACEYQSVLSAFCQLVSRCGVWHASPNPRPGVTGCVPSFSCIAACASLSISWAIYWRGLDGRSSVTRSIPRS